MSKDHIYSMPLERVGDFEFDERVVDVFPDMIARSVPGYASVLTMTAELAQRFALPGTQIYDLGCSLGAATFLIRPRVHSDCTIQAIDSSPAMVARLTELVSTHNETGCNVNICKSDIRNVRLSNASFTILNFTLQFIPPEERRSLLENVFDGLLDGGALVLSEKVHFDDPARQELLTELLHSFKRAHGYSELEIAQKRSALENTLTTETIETHVDRLKQIGFSDVLVWFQCFNFVSILAVK